MQRQKFYNLQGKCCFYCVLKRAKFARSVFTMAKINRTEVFAFFGTKNYLIKKCFTV
jgi:hypothetical protein